MSPFYNSPEHQPFQMGSGATGALLLHGFPGTPAEMRPLGERLASAGWTVYGPLLPGFGPEIPTLAQKTRHDWLAAAEEAWHRVEANHDTAVLVGFSMGGALALNLAAAHKPDTLVLLAPFWRFGSWMARLLPILKYVRKSFYPFAQADFSDPAVRRQLSAISPETDLDDLAVQARLREEIQLPLKIIDEVRLLGKRGGKVAPTIHSPSLVLQGTEDLLVLPRLTRRLMTRLSGPVTYREIPGGHDFPKMAKPEAIDISAEILHYLQK